MKLDRRRGKMGKKKNFKVFYPSDLKGLDKEWIEENLKPSDIDEYELLEGEINGIPGKIVFPVKMSKAFYFMDRRLQTIEAKMDLLFAMMKHEEEDLEEYLKEIYQEIGKEVSSLMGEKINSFIREEISSLMKKEVSSLMREEISSLMRRELSSLGVQEKPTQPKPKPKIQPEIQPKPEPKTKPVRDTVEEKKLTIFEALEELENKDLPLRISQLKKLDGNYSSVVSMIYRIFDSWAHCVDEYYRFKGHTPSKVDKVAVIPKKEKVTPRKEEDTPLYTDMDLNLIYIAKGQEDEFSFDAEIREKEREKESKVEDTPSQEKTPVIPEGREPALSTAEERVKQRAREVAKERAKERAKIKEEEEAIPQKEIPNLVDKKLKIYRIMAEAERQGIPLNTSAFNQKGGKFSTACSSVYKIFSSWKDAVKAYKIEFKTKTEEKRDDTDYVIEM